MHLAKRTWLATTPRSAFHFSSEYLFSINGYVPWQQVKSSSRAVINPSDWWVSLGPRNWQAVKAWSQPKICLCLLIRIKWLYLKYEGGLRLDKPSDTLCCNIKSGTRLSKATLSRVNVKLCTGPFAIKEHQFVFEHLLSYQNLYSKWCMNCPYGKMETTSRSNILPLCWH